MFCLSLMMRWLHLFSAITAIGTTIFLRLALLPATEKSSDEAKATLLRNLAKPLRLLIHGAIAGLLLSGLYNISTQWRTAVFPYPVIFAIKAVLAFLIFAIAILLTSSSPKQTAFQAKQKTWLTINLVLAAILVALSAYLKTLHR
jgi:uncharacterized membrane protein